MRGKVGHLWCLCAVTKTVGSYRRFQLFELLPKRCLVGRSRECGPSLLYKLMDSTPTGHSTRHCVILSQSTGGRGLEKFQNDVVILGQITIDQQFLHDFLSCLR